MSNKDLIKIVDRVHELVECHDYASLEAVFRDMSKILEDEGGSLFLQGMKFGSEAYRMYDKGALAPDIVAVLTKALQMFHTAQKSKQKHPDLDHLLLSEISRAECFISALTDSTQNAIEMIIQLEGSLDKNPFDFITNFRRAQLLYTLDEYGEAKIALLKCISLDRDHYRPYYILGNLYCAEGQFRKAIYSYKKSLEKQPDGNPALNNLGIAYYLLGNHKEAEAYLRKGEQKNLHDAFFPGNLGFMLVRKYYRIGGEQEVLAHFNEILSLYEKAITGPEYGANPHFNRSFLLYLAEKHGKDYSRLKKERALGSFSKTRELYEMAENKVGVLVCNYFVNKCRRKQAENPQDKLLDRLLFDVMNFMTKTEDIKKIHNSFLSRGDYVKSDLDHNHLCVLKQWRPETHPAPKEFIEGGGGYYFRWENSGVVINPGRNFLANFRNQGYVISDIDIILVTNGNPGHSSEFEGLLILTEELNNHLRVKQPEEEKTHRVKLLLNSRLIQILTRICDRFDVIDSIVSLMPNQTLNLTPNIVLNTHSVYRKKETGDICEYFEEIGLVFSLGNKDTSLSLGYLNNSCFNEKLTRSFGDCDILILSVGTLFFKELLSPEVGEQFLVDLERWVSKLSIGELQALGFKDWKDFKTLKDMLLSKPALRPNNSYSPHDLGFLGALDLLRKSKPGICVLTNLPHELGNLRHKIAEILDEEYGRVKVLTGDIGLRVRLDDLFVFCEFESKYKHPKKIGELASENPEGVVRHICYAHKNDPRIGEFLDMPR